jgi:hypothetical protein
LQKTLPPCCDPKSYLRSRYSPPCLLHHHQDISHITSFLLPDLLDRASIRCMVAHTMVILLHPNSRMPWQERPRRTCSSTQMRQQCRRWPPQPR